MNVYVQGQSPDFHIFQTRQAIAKEIDRLIALMDAIDGDADFEHSLGAPENHPSCGYVFGKEFAADWSAPINRDGEPESEGETDVDVTDEPHDECAEGNDEGSLGWTNALNQDAADRYTSDRGTDAEFDPADPGFGRGVRYAGFDQSGIAIARDILRGIRRQGRTVAELGEFGSSRGGRKFGVIRAVARCL